MICPNCSNTLIQVKTKAALVDTCPACKGIWFDPGEFGDFVNLLSQNENVKAAKIKYFKRRQVESLHNVKEERRLCPRCRSEMKKFNYAYDSNVILDKCPNCNGIWADASESKMVAAYLKDDPQANRLAAAMLEMTKPPDIEDPFGSREVIRFLYCPRIIVPFADDAQRDKFPIITILLIITSVLFSVIGLMASKQWLADTLDVVDQFGSKFGFSLMGTLFAQGGIIHLAWNMLFLWLFGDNIEDRFSRAGYLLFFVFCGMFSWAIYQITGSQASSFAVAVSSAVSAVMGAYLIFYPTANLKLFVVGFIKEIPVTLFIGLWFIFQLIYPFLFGTNASFGSITLAHLTGFAMGLTIAFVQKLKKP